MISEELTLSGFMMTLSLDRTHSSVNDEGQPTNEPIHVLNDNDGTSGQRRHLMDQFV